jgi:hypothetical protein
MNVISICTNTAADGSKRVPAGIYEYFVYPLVYNTPGAKIQLIGISSCKVMVNQPAFVGADQQDVVGSSHGGDQAMALACIPFQCINGKHASLAIPCKEIHIGQTVLRRCSSSDAAATILV